jgi:hypothetical protein
MSTRFLERGRHYRYAAALSDNPRAINGLLDLAFMFEQLARDFARADSRKQTAGLPGNTEKLSVRFTIMKLRRVIRIHTDSSHPVSKSQRA